MRSGEIVTVGPNGMTGTHSVVGIEARRLPISMNSQILMPGERTQAPATCAAKRGFSASAQGCGIRMRIRGVRCSAAT